MFVMPVDFWRASKTYHYWEMSDAMTLTIDLTAPVLYDSVSYDGQVGVTGNGRLLLSACNFKDANGYVGKNAASSGNVTLSGSGCIWQHTGSVYIGNSGKGGLEIPGTNSYVTVVLPSYQ